MRRGDPFSWHALNRDDRILRAVRWLVYLLLMVGVLLYFFSSRG